MVKAHIFSGARLVFFYIIFPLPTPSADRVSICQTCFYLTCGS